MVYRQFIRFIRKMYPRNKTHRYLRTAKGVLYLNSVGGEAKSLLIT